MNHIKTKILSLVFGIAVCGSLAITANAEEKTMAMSSVSYSSNTEKLAAPSGFKVKDTSAYTVTLSWKEVEGADGYRIYKYNSSTDKFEKLKNIGKKTSYTVSGLDKGKEYKFKVTALTKYDETYVVANTLSKEVSATTKTDVRNGWVTENKEKYYYVNDTAVKSKTKKIDGKIYLFGKTGKLLTGGTYKVNDDKYNVDKNGVVTCNKWLSTKNGKKSNTYYYATSSGKINEYTFVEMASVTDSITGLPIANQLYINGLPATSSDSSLFWRSGLCRMGEDYYSFGVADSCVFVIKNMSDTALSDRSITVAIDLGSGKELGWFYGKCSHNSKGCITNAALYNTSDKQIYSFDKNGKLTKKAVSSPLMITESKTSVNSAGGVNWSMSYINGSSKTIKYATFSVCVKNAVDDKVRCTIWNRYSFLLKDTGPIKSGETSYCYWDAFMYNYSGNTVEIESVTIEYMDGTTQVIKPNSILNLC